MGLYLNRHGTISKSTWDCIKINMVLYQNRHGTIIIKIDMGLYQSQHGTMSKPTWHYALINMGLYQNRHEICKITDNGHTWNQGTDLDVLREIPDHATFREKGHTLGWLDKLVFFLSLALCNLANFDQL